MILSKTVIRALSEKAGVDITTPSGATFLANDIESKTGERLAANTIKRLAGVLPYQNNPRLTTLDIIARYLGYSSWAVFVDGEYCGSSLFNDTGRFVIARKLKPNVAVRLLWEPFRQVVLRHISGNEFEVQLNINSKLQEGDILTIHQIGRECPLYVENVVRNGISLGSYTAAMEDGIYGITILE